MFVREESLKAESLSSNSVTRYNANPFKNIFNGLFWVPKYQMFYITLNINISMPSSLVQKIQTLYMSLVSYS